MDISIHQILIKSCLGILILFLVFLALSSPGKPKPYTDSSGKAIEGSISEKGYLKVNDAKLGYFIKSKNRHNPVLLYLHGGMPDYFLTEKYPTGLDEIFTVVWLDQRGAGLSYDAQFPAGEKISDVLVNDVVEAAKQLSARFLKDKIYLMGHSGGTYLGVKAIEKHPDYFHAYIGVVQIAYQKESERSAYNYILKKYKVDSRRQNEYQALLGNPVELDKPIPKAYASMRDKAMHELGIGTVRSMKGVVSGIFIPSLLFSEYSLSDKFNLWRGKANSGISMLWDEMMNHDLRIESINFSIPFYILHGIHDYTCSYELSKDYFNKINAPQKGFYTFFDSAHSPIFEEPLESVRIIKDTILK